MLQARMEKGDRRLYNVSRDLAHCFGELLTEAVKRCTARPWKELSDLGDREGVTGENIAETSAALLKFLGIQADFPKESMFDGLYRSGYTQLPAAPRIVLMAYLGSVVLGAHWAGVREATLGGEGPALVYKDLAAHGEHLVKLASMPAWQRPLYKLGQRAQKAWQAFRG